MFVGIMPNISLADNSPIMELGGMPVINLSGSLDGISKNKKVTVGVSYSSETKSFSSKATLKIQGGTSIYFPKNNYTIQFLKDDGSKNKVCLVDSWGKQSKYCLKANWVDYSQARNVVSGRLFNQIVHSRGFDDELDALNNGGVVDGYPVLIYLNGDFLGLYTLNIPKDSWMFGMNGSGRQALLFGDTGGDSVILRKEIGDVNNVAASGWDLEYCSTEDDDSVGTAWVAESMNAFIRFLMNNTGEAFKAGIGQYTDIDRAIDCLIFTYFIHACDNIYKNTIWASYDGVKWIPSVYDMDGTWGMVWDGSFTYSANDFAPDGSNLLYQRLLENYKDRITARYKELREDILSIHNIEKQFSSFFAQIPDAAYEAEAKKWPTVPSHDKNNYQQIINYAKERVAYFDEWFGVEITEKSDSAYKASFSAPTGTKIYVYASKDYSVDPVRAISAFSVTEDGKLTKEDGQVNFKIVPPDGYAVKEVTVSPKGSYKNIKGPADTKQDNTYRITKLTGDVDVFVSVENIGADPDPEGYKASFVCDHAKVYVYPGQDYSDTPVCTEQAECADSDTGIPTKSGDGQINFLVVPDYGYQVSNIEITPKNYKNLKGYEDTGFRDVYRITKITGDITVCISTEKLPPELTVKASDKIIGIGQSAKLTASVEYLPEGAYVIWNVSGTKKYTVSEDTMSCTIKGTVKGDIRVTATVVSADGSTYENAEASTSATIKVNIFSFTDDVQSYLLSLYNGIIDMIRQMFGSVKNFFGR